MILMENSFSYKGLKFFESLKIFLCKLFTPLDYPSTLDYNAVLLTTRYIDYQTFSLYKRLPFLGSCSED